MSTVRGGSRSAVENVNGAIDLSLACARSVITGCHEICQNLEADHARKREKGSVDHSPQTVHHPDHLVTRIHLLQVDHRGVVKVGVKSDFYGNVFLWV